MLRRAYGAAAAVLAALAVAPPPASADQAVVGDRASVVDQLVVLTRPDRDDVFTIERRLRCEDDCVAVLQAVPASGTWERRSPRGWAGSALAPFNHPAVGAGLVAAGAGGLEVSTDDAASFTPVDGAAGTLRVATYDERSLAIVVGGGDQAQVVTWPARRHLPVTAPGLDRPDVVLHPDFPKVPPGQPAALAGGTETTTGYMAVAPCDASLRCGVPVVVTPRRDYPRLHLSPKFGSDSTVYVAGAAGGLYTSGDGGRTFTQVVVTGGREPGTITATAQAVVFTSDFDASRRTGSVYVGVMAVVGEVNGEGRTSGGVYRSHQGGPWSRFAPGGPPDTGVTSLAVTRSGALYVGFVAPPDGGGVACSADGRTWHAVCDEAAHRPPRGAGRTAGPDPGAGPGGNPAGGPTERGLFAPPAPVAETGTHPDLERRGGRTGVAGWVIGVAVAAAVGAAAGRRRQLTARRIWS